MVSVGIIGGSGVYALLEDSKSKKVKTPYGIVSDLSIGTIDGIEVAFVPRHGKDHSFPPHRVNYRANIDALSKLGVERILATTAVGSLHPQLPPGKLALLKNFIDFTNDRISTFFDGKDGNVIHVSVNDPYCTDMSSLVRKTSEKLNIEIYPEGVVYICANGPRFETAAEINMFKIMGADVVGMTSVPEVVLARERSMCYCTLAIITNWATGLCKSAHSNAEIIRLMNENIEHVKKIFGKVIKSLPKKRSCACVQEIEYGLCCQ